MVDIQTDDALDADLSSPEFQKGEARGFWRFSSRHGDILYVNVYAWDGDSYLLQLACDAYRVEACRGRFVDPQTLQCVPSAWPQGEGAFGGWFKWQAENFFICWPGDRGGLDHHADWLALRYWTRTANPLVQYLEFLRQCLNVRAHGYLPKQRQTLVS